MRDDLLAANTNGMFGEWSCANEECGNYQRKGQEVRRLTTVRGNMPTDPSRFAKTTIKCSVCSTISGVQA